MLQDMEARSLSPAVKRLNIDNLAVMLTYRCQMDCRYCHLDRSHPDMSEDVLKRSIELLLTSPSREVELQFFGGEPLLRYDLIQKAIAYASVQGPKHGKSVKYLLTTNGLLLDERKLRFLKKHNVVLMLSIDGTISVQLNNRPLLGKKGQDYHTRLIANLKRAVNSGMKYFVNLTFLPDGIAGLESNVAYLLGLGVRDIQLSYAIGAGFGEEELVSYSRALRNIVRLAADKGVRLRNADADVEPIFASPQINVSSSGDIYLGCAFVIEKEFTGSHKLFYAGNIKEILDISILKRSREQQLEFLLSREDKLDKRLLNDLYFGAGLYAFWKNRLMNKAVSLPADNGRSEEARNYLYTNKMMLMLTYRCQMDCRYCHLDRSHPDMSEDVLKRSIELLLTSPSREVELQFFGGEPLLRYDLIQKAIAYAGKRSREEHKTVKYLITTNGLLLDERKLRFLKKHNVYFLLSLDGLKGTQAFNRPLVNRKQEYPFGLLLKKLRLLSSWQSDFFVNMVIGPDNISSFQANVGHFLKSGVKKIRFSYELGRYWKDEEVARFFAGLFKVVERIRSTSVAGIINIGVDDEPYLMSPALTVDHDGKIYCGCTIPLEKSLPRLLRANQVGDVSSGRPIREIKRSKSQGYATMLKTYAAGTEQHDIIVNNLALGELSQEFFNGLLGPAAQDRQAKQAQGGNVNSVMVMCTYACQLDCDYCQVKRLNRSMPRENLVKTIDMLLTTASDNCQLRFWGGEPLLRWDFIKDGIRLAEKMAREHGKAIRFMITTNGLLLDKGKLDYLKGHAVEVMLSLDGDCQANLAHRFLRGGERLYDKVVENLRLLVGSGLPYFVNIVVSPFTVDRLSANLEFLKKLGISRVQLCYQNGIIWEEASSARLIQELRGFLSGYPDNGFLMNFKSDCEPTMLSQEVLADTDGAVYSDAAIFMEAKFPRLRKAFFRGVAAEIKDIDSLYRTRNELYDIFRNSCSGHEKKVFDNNIALGLKLDAFFNSFHQQSLDSNEHPLLIPVIKGDFPSQRKLLNNLKIDSLYLYLNGPCLNDCIFCKHKDEEYSELFRIEAKLMGNSELKAKKLCIIGNDPLLHPQISLIVEKSRQYGFKYIEIMTSGEKLSDNEFCRDLIRKGASAFSIPLFSAISNVHDHIARREGSFSQVIKGVHNVKANKGKVFLHSNLIKQNLGFMRDLEEFAVKELKVPFVILPIRSKTANLVFPELMPSYAEIISNLGGTDSLMCFPLCVIKKTGQKDLLKANDAISDSMKLYVLDQRFIKLKKCRDCFYARACSGLFKEYLQYYRPSQIQPYPVINAQKDIIRQRMLKKIASLSSGSKKKMDAAILKNVLGLKELRKAKKVCIFLYEGGINTGSLIAKCLKMRKDVYASFYPAGKKHVFYKIDSLKDLEPGVKKTGLKKFRGFGGLGTLDLVIAACLAYDKQGYIVGRGFGDRDRFLEQYPGLVRKEIHLAYSFQRVGSFPKHKYDLPTCTIVTDKGVCNFGPQEVLDE